MGLGTCAVRHRRRSAYLATATLFSQVALGIAAAIGLANPARL
jgi:hypothetical protein